MPDSSRSSDKYTSRYLNSLSEPYRRRIQSFLRRNPDANITQARGHRASTSARAQRSRLAPRERYTPEYLETLSSNWRRQIERELRISQEEEREFIMPGSLRRTAFQLYSTHIDMLDTTLDTINDKGPGEYTFHPNIIDGNKVLLGTLVDFHLHTITATF